MYMYHKYKMYVADI